MSDSLGLTPETAIKKLKELAVQKKRLEAEIEHTGIDLSYMDLNSLPQQTARNFVSLRTRFGTINEDIGKLIEWFNFYYLERLQTSTQTLVALTKELESGSRKVNRLTWGLVGLTVALVVAT